MIESASARPPLLLRITDSQPPHPFLLRHDHRKFTLEIFPWTRKKGGVHATPALVATLHFLWSSVGISFVEISLDRETS